MNFVQVWWILAQPTWKGNLVISCSVEARGCSCLQMLSGTNGEESCDTHWFGKAPTTHQASFHMLSRCKVRLKGLIGEKIDIRINIYVILRILVLSWSQNVIFSYFSQTRKNIFSSSNHSHSSQETKLFPSANHHRCAKSSWSEEPLTHLKWGQIFFLNEIS